MTAPPAIPLRCTSLSENPPRQVQARPQAARDALVASSGDVGLPRNLSADNQWSGQHGKQVLEEAIKVGDGRHQTPNVRIFMGRGIDWGFADLNAY
jgi:hypothetical protein